MLCTTVITTYNRIHCVASAIQSALLTFPTGEVVVVDDASKDGTLELIQQTFADAIAKGRIQLIALNKNLGVTGAKNAGFEHAKGEWVLFLDSDDAYCPDVGPLMEAQFAHASDRPIIFFRCRNQLGQFVGEHEGQEVQLDLMTYLQHTSYGEALTAVNKRRVGQTLPYLTELRGYEGLGCCRLIHRFGPALLSKVVARTYDTAGEDRLSVSRGLLNRMPLLAKGHLMIVQEFWRAMRIPKSLSYLAKATVYWLLGNGYRIVKGKAT